LKIPFGEKDGDPSLRSGWQKKRGSEWPFLSPWGEAEGSPLGILRWRLL